MKFVLDVLKLQELIVITAGRPSTLRGLRLTSREA